MVETLLRTLPSQLGSYLLVREIGQGASSIVYEATHATHGRRMALKVLAKSALSPGQLAREGALVAREAMILAALPGHPALVGVVEVGLAAGSPFIAM